MKKYKKQWAYTITFLKATEAFLKDAAHSSLVCQCNPIQGNTTYQTQRICLSK